MILYHKNGNYEIKTLNDDKGYDKDENCGKETLDDEKC